MGVQCKPFHCTDVYIHFISEWFRYFIPIQLRRTNELRHTNHQIVLVGSLELHILENGKGRKKPTKTQPIHRRDMICEFSAFFVFSRFHSIIITVNHVRLPANNCQMDENASILIRRTVVLASLLLVQLFQLCHCSLSLRLPTIGWCSMPGKWNWNCLNV